jgi:hypothetical protein
MHVAGRPPRRRWVAEGLSIAIGALLIAPVARADDVKQVCAADYEEAQVRRQKGALLTSRDALRSCTRVVCPQVIQKDCARWLDEVERAIPSVLVHATADGKDAIDVAVTIDGVLSRSRLDGSPIELDPGGHELVFALADYPEVHERILLLEGEARREVNVRFTQPRSSAPPPAPEPRRSTRPVPPSIYVLGAVSLAAAASFVTFGALASSERAHLRGTCSPFCTDADTRALRTQILVADVSLAVSIASLGVATVLYLTRPSREARAPSGLTLVAVPTAAGGTFALTGRY